MPNLGDRIGHIRLVGVLGKGGTGIVYSGLDEKLNRKVAVKAIKARRIGSSARTHLLREARLLSQLDHPNICRIHGFVEGNETDFLILEQIRGRTLRQVLDDGMDNALKLRVAEQIALALEAAHQQGVVHRDLKPQNVMLTEEGIAKVLDFGIAWRADDPPFVGSVHNDPNPRIEPRSVDSSDTSTWVHRAPDASTMQELAGGAVRAGAIIGTAAYMSPEQARGETTTAASDVYSLGLLLQEVFTGRSPFDPDLNCGELVRSAAAGTSLAVTGVDAEVGALLQRMKAGAPEARPTVSEVAERLRWIRRRPRRRAWRFVAVAAMLMVGFAVFRYTVDLRRERAAALEARNEAEQVASFMADVFLVADPEQSRGATVTARELLDQGSVRIREALDDQPQTQARLMLTIGSVYRRLGLFEPAAQLIEEALELRKALRGEDHLEVAQCLVLAADVYAAQGRFEVAETAAVRALSILEEDLGPEHSETASCLALLGTIYLRQGLYENAEPMFIRNLAILEADANADPQRLADTLSNLAVLHRQRGNLEAAEDASRQALDIRRRSLGSDHPNIALSYNNLAVLLYVQERYAESAEQLGYALRIWEKTLGTDHPNVATCVNNLAELAWKQGKYDESETLFLRALVIWEKAVGPDHLDTAFAVHGLANLYRDTGRVDEAEAAYRRVLEIREASLSPDHPDLVATREDSEGLRLAIEGM